MRVFALIGCGPRKLLTTVGAETINFHRLAILAILPLLAVVAIGSALGAMTGIALTSFSFGQARNGSETRSA